MTNGLAFNMKSCSPTEKTSSAHTIAGNSAAKIRTVESDTPRQAVMDFFTARKFLTLFLEIHSASSKSLLHMLGRLSKRTGLVRDTGRHLWVQRSCAFTKRFAASTLMNVALLK